MVSSEEQLPLEDGSLEDVYRRLAHEHSESVYELATLLVGDPGTASQVLADAFRRTWTTLNQERMVGDPIETVYWSAIREGLSQARREKLRGHLPATTADDRQITAFGIVQNFTPQQQAAIFLAARTGLGYKRAGLASGLGESRVRDLVFAARQEYRDEREKADEATSECHQAAPTLSARTDDAEGVPPSSLDIHINTCPVCSRTAALFSEFSEALKAVRIPPPPEPSEQVAIAQLEARGSVRPPSGMGRILRAAAMPFLITFALVAGLLVFRGFFSDPEVATGVGRTSDLLYARDSTSGSTLVLDSGSGRTLARLPAGSVGASGQRLYSGTAACQPLPCSTVLRVIDPATGAESAVGRVDGALTLVGVDERLGRWFLADTASDGGQTLVAFDAAVGEIVSKAMAPTGVRDPFAPAHAVLSPDGATLLTLGVKADDGQAVLVRTDLRSMEVRATVPLQGTPEEYAALLQRPSLNRVLAYHLGSGVVLEVDLGSASILRSAQLERPPASEVRRESPGSALAAAPDGTIFAVTGGGGVAALSPESLAEIRRLGQDRSGQYPTYTSVSASTDGRLLYLVEAPRREERDATAAYVVVDVADGRQLVRRTNAGAIALVQVNAGE